MGTTADKLLYLQDTKRAIKDAIVAKGVTVPTGTTFREYANKIGDITTGGTTPPIAEPWVRPTEWLALPDNVDGVQKVSILNAVFDTDSEFVAMVFEGDYTVDWGDGVIENFASGVTAEHKYEYSSANLNSDTVAKFGYKQCIITITPQAGNNLTLINLNTYHSVIGVDTDNITGALDIRINSIYCTSIFIGSQNNTDSNSYITWSLLKNVHIGEHSCFSFNHLFRSCSMLEKVTIDSTSNVTSMVSMFANCVSLTKIPEFDYSSCTTLEGMLAYCSSIKFLPPFNTSSSLVNLKSVVQFCTKLLNVPVFSDTSNVTNIANMFSGCTALTRISNLSFPSTPGTTVGTFASTTKEFIDVDFGNSLTPSFGSGLSRFRVIVRNNFSISNCRMSATALNEMYTALPTVTGKTVTVTGNYGVSGDDPTIATAKGWTVVG